MTTEEAIDNIVAHLKIEHDIDVVFGDDELGAYYHDSGIIGINTDRICSAQLFVLLHEAGHAISPSRQGRFLNIDEKTEGKRLRLLEEERGLERGQNSGRLHENKH
jgi:Zn-dependent peptidase ImmA (M78 family)